MKKIYNVGFWDNQLCERGTTVGLFRYAFYNQKLYGHKSFIFYDKNNKDNKRFVIDKFHKHFVVHETDDFREVDMYVEKYGITHMFIIKSGEKDNRISKLAKNCIQCVFNCTQPHGDIYCSIEKWVKGNNGIYPVIPRIIELPESKENLREELHIPNDAVVFGGYGGKMNFSIKYVQEVVYNVARKYKNIFFLFANFSRFCPRLPNIIHIPCIKEDIKKTFFINTCDAMIWARSDGETFGQSIGEFSIKNKPIIATKNVRDKVHCFILKDKAMWYKNKETLRTILLTFNPSVESKKDWNAFKEYNHTNVMSKFRQILFSE